MKTYTVAVRTLCEFAAKQGDLDLRFAPSPTSQQGINGHQTVAASRSASYRSEVSLSGEYRHLVVRGRADGYDTDQQLLEEIKTFKGDLNLIPGTIGTFTGRRPRSTAHWCAGSSIWPS